MDQTFIMPLQRLNAEAILQTLIQRRSSAAPLQRQHAAMPRAALLGALYHHHNDNSDHFTALQQPRASAITSCHQKVESSWDAEKFLPWDNQFRHSTIYFFFFFLV